MSLTPEKLAELRRLLDEAPPLPYRDSPATHGDPSNGPTYVALEAQWEGRWEEVATGNYEKWCGMGIALAAAAVNALPDLLDQLAAAEAALNDAILYENEVRDALARQTPPYLAAEAALARVRAVLAWIDTAEVRCGKDARIDDLIRVVALDRIARALDESEADK